MLTKNNQPIAEGEFVSAWVGDECRAIGQVIVNESNSYTTLVVNGIDKENVTFKLYDGENVFSTATSIETNPGESIGIVNVDFAQATILHTPVKELAVSVFPNPTSGMVNIVLPNDFDITSIEVVNYTGKLIANLSNQSKNSTIQWNASNVPEGIYLIKITTNDISITKKLVISK
jgi:hypothetical protein